MAELDPFTAAFGDVSKPAPPPSPTPAAGEGGEDAFSAAFGTSIAAGGGDVADAPPEAGVDLGMGNALAGSIIEGIPIVGPNLKGGIDQGIAWLRSLSSGRSPEEEYRDIQLDTSRTREAHPIAAEVGHFTGQVAGYGAAVVGAPAAFGIGASSLATGAAVSGTTNALVAAADAYARGEDPLRAAEIGGALGAAGPVVGQAAKTLFTSYVAPEVARLADLAMNKFGIPLGADLLSANPMVRFASSVMNRMPLSGGTKAVAERHKAFTRAVAGLMGENADALTPSVMRNAKARIGNMFEYAAKNTPQVGADAQLGKDWTIILDEIRNPVDRALTQDERKIVEKQLQNVLDLFAKGRGSITGQQYQQITRQGTMLDRALNSTNPNIKHYAIMIKASLDDALLRFAPPDAAQMLATARKQWWVMKTVEDLAEKAPTGEISPSLLMGAVRSNTGTMAYGGGGDIAELARIGQLFLKEAPSSGTAERSLIMKTATELASAGGLWSVFHHPAAAVAGLVVPVALGRIAGGIARSPKLANHLVQSAINGPGTLASGIGSAATAIVPVARQPIQNLLPER